MCLKSLTCRKTGVKLRTNNNKKKYSTNILTNMLVIGMAVRNFTISCIRFSWLRKFFKQRSMCIWWSASLFNKSYKKRSHWRFNVIVLMILLFSIEFGIISNDGRFPSGAINNSIRSVISFNEALNCNLVVLYPLRTVFSTKQFFFYFLEERMEQTSIKQDWEICQKQKKRERKIEIDRVKKGKKSQNNSSLN